jgi:hypothetical protein
VIRNRTLALLALLFSVAILLAGFRELYRPFLRTREPLFVSAGMVYMIGLMALSAVRVKCSHERLWLGIALTGSIVLLIKGWFPDFVAPAITTVRLVLVLLWLGATLVSVRFVMSAFGTGPSRGSG